jgi:hypothetical protein
MITKKKVIITIVVLVVLITGLMLLRNQEGASEAEKKKATEAVNNKVYVRVQQVNFMKKQQELNSRLPWKRRRKVS